MNRFTIIFGYRNREVERIRNCLSTLAAQTFQSFDVIFVDYGSDASIAREIREVTAEFPFVKYVYNETRGWHWNRSHALNTGIRLSGGEYTITTDVDLLFPPDFLEKLDREIAPDRLIHGKAIYLPADFTDFKNVHKRSQDLIEKYLHANETALGLCQVVYTQHLHKINGFDEYYRIWGVEDLDINKRLRDLGLEMSWLDIRQFPVFHQWHPPAQMYDIDKAPRMWLDIMMKYYQEKTETVNTDPEWGKIYTLDTRPALKIMLDGDYSGIMTHVFEIPFEYTFNRFVRMVEDLEMGDALCVNQDFKEESFGHRSKAGRTIDIINQLLRKMKTSYRFVDYRQYEEGILDYYLVRDNVFYYLVNHLKAFTDYCIDWSGRRIYFLVVK